jgi:folate-dependent phosphoribosylglycinamide formyltransferase PurN
VYGKLVEILHRSLHLEENETSTAIASLSEADSAQVVQTVRNKQKTAELVLHLMLSMSADPIMTETLALAGVMRVLSNNTLRAFQEMHLTYANVLSLSLSDTSP